MSMSDRFDDKADEVVGRAKARTGDATGNDRLRAEGRSQQARGGLRGAIQKIKDAFRR